MAAIPQNKSMAGKVCMITGATSGIGRAMAFGLARLGATTIVVGRDEAKCQSTVQQIREETGNPAVEYMVADLSSQQEIRRLAQQFLDQHRPLDVLINNAGGGFVRRQESADGLEMTFALNHLGYFLLTNLLLPALEASPAARIVNVASRQHQFARMNFADLNAVKRYGGLGAYGQSKLANVLFTYELARRLNGTNITVNAFHPGGVKTNLWADNGPAGSLFRSYMVFGALSPEQGAETGVFLASSPEVAGTTGKYFARKRAVSSSSASYDEAAARRLWQISAELTGLQEAGQVAPARAA